MRFLRFAVVASIVAAAVIHCGTENCSTQEDCPIGFYCVLNFAAGRAEGTCEQDCASSSDCAQPASNASRAICTNEGRCRVEPRPLRLVIRDPEPDTVFEEGTQSIALSGEIEMPSGSTTLMVTTSGNRGCGTGISRQITIENTTGGFTSVPFVLNDVILDPGDSELMVQAISQGGAMMSPIPVSVACPGCADIRISQPRTNSTVPALKLPFLRATVSPNAGAAVWRVQGLGGVLDGTLPFNGIDYGANDVPIFPGPNRVEVVVTGFGSGRGETRCTVLVNAGVTAETGLRAILTWDGQTADLDLHLIGPGGQYGDPATTLSSRTRNPLGFSGVVEDDFDGLGPEVITVNNLPDGEYGLVVEAVFDDLDPGSTALLRVLFDGRTLTSGPIGPQYLQAIAGDLWIVGTVQVTNGQAAFRSVDLRATAANPPTAAPSVWPALF